MKNKTIVITGGAGFIGSNIAIYLKTNFDKINVIALDNLKRQGSHLNIDRLKKSGVKFIHGDIRNKEDLETIQSFNIMIECSAEPSVLAGIGDSPEYVINTNLKGTINCLELVRKRQASIIFLSTSRVYPILDLKKIKLNELNKRFSPLSQQSLPGISLKGISENFPLNNPRSLYGATKLTSEIIIKEYINMYNIKGVINRCSIIAGPWQMGKVDQGVIALWVASHIYNKPLKYIGFNGCGKQVRDVLHVNDLARLIVMQIKNLNKFNGKTYNVGGGKDNSLSLLELTGLCEKITKHKMIISAVKKTNEFDIPYYVTDNKKIFSESSWRPEKNLTKIIEDIYKWIMENKKSLINVFT